jgi:hypothetical protein
MIVSYSDNERDSSLPSLALYTFRKVIEAHLGKRHFPNTAFQIVFTDNRKSMLNIEQWRGAGFTCSYPFAFAEVTSVTGDVADNSVIGNAKIALKRHGTGYLKDAATNATILKNFLTDIRIDLTVHFQTEQPMDALMFVTDVIVLQKADIFTTMIKDSYGERLLTIKAETSISWPKPATEDAAAPGVFDLEIPFSLQLKVGTQKDVPKINNEGRVDINVSPATGGQT